MSSLYFYYATMSSGKSTNLLQSSHNYKEKGMKTMLLTPVLDDRYGEGKITSRIGIQESAKTFNNADDLYKKIKNENSDRKLSCILIDESQFLTMEQVKQLTNIVDNLNIPVLCYGLRTDFQGNLFTGSQYLLAWADKLIELKSICHCGKKATMVLRLDDVGCVVKSGEQIDIGGNDKYTSVCRKHFNKEINDK